MGKGLFIGINYEGTSSQLNGCKNDSRSLARYFEKKGYTNEILISKQTKDNIIKKIKNLARDSFQSHDKNYVIQYSGHGTNVPDTNGDERDGKDEGLVASDMKLLKDDEINILLSDFHPNSTILLIADSCHSGTCADLQYSYGKDFNHIEESKIVLKQKILLISGCLDNQYSMDTYSNIRKESCGAMSNALIKFDILETPIFDLIRNIRSAVSCYNQFPLLSSSFIVENISIRDLFDL